MYEFFPNLNFDHSIFHNCRSIRKNVTTLNEIKNQTLTHICLTPVNDRFLIKKIPYFYDSTYILMAFYIKFPDFMYKFSLSNIFIPNDSTFSVLFSLFLDFIVLAIHFHTYTQKRYSDAAWKMRGSTKSS